MLQVAQRARLSVTARDRMTAIDEANGAKGKPAFEAPPPPGLAKAAACTVRRKVRRSAAAASAPVP